MKRKSRDRSSHLRQVSTAVPQPDSLPHVFLNHFYVSWILPPTLQSKRMSFYVGISL